MIVIGLKKFLSNGDNLQGLPYKVHKPGFAIKENSLKYWVGDLHQFIGWELYIPDVYIKKIKSQMRVQSVEYREFIVFDTKYLLSVLR